MSRLFEAHGRIVSSNNRLAIGMIDDALHRARAEAAADAIRQEFPRLSVELVIADPKAGAGGRASRSPNAHPPAGLESQLAKGNFHLLALPAEELLTDPLRGLQVAAFLRRNTPFDVLLSREAATLDELPERARVVTKTLRRRAQLAVYREDLVFHEARGPVEESREELLRGTCQAVVFSADAAERLGLQTLVGEILEPGVCLPAPGQGALVLLARASDKETLRVLQSVNDTGTEAEVTAEWSFLRALGTSSCEAVGALARVQGTEIYLDGAVLGSEDGDMARDQMSGETENAGLLGKDLAERILMLGGDELLRPTRRRSARSD